MTPLPRPSKGLQECSGGVFHGDPLSQSLGGQGAAPSSICSLQRLPSGQKACSDLLGPSDLSPALTCLIPEPWQGLEDARTRQGPLEHLSRCRASLHARACARRGLLQA